MFTYLACKKSTNHCDELLTNYCIDDDCKKKELACGFCENESHFKHRMISVKYLITKLSKMPEILENQQQFEDLMHYVNEQEKDFKLHIFNYLGSVQTVIEKMKKDSQSFFENLREILKEKIFKSKQMNNKSIFEQIQNGKMKDRETLQQNLSILIDHLVISEDNQFHQKVDIKEIKDGILQRQNELKENLKKMLSSIEQNAGSLKTSAFKDIKIQTKINSQATKFFFSNTLKSPTVELSKEQTVCTQISSSAISGQHFVLVDSKISKSQKTQFSFKILKVNSWLGIGLVNKNQIVNTQYKFQNFTNIGHGCFLLGCNGRTYNNVKQEQNYKQVTFTYAENDVIIILCDPKSKKIQFIKNDISVGSQYEMDFDFDQNDDLVPCACLYYKDNSVEVLN